MDSPVLALLEIAGRKRAPDTVKLNRQPLMEGSVLIASFGIGIGELEDDLLGDFDRERRNASFYKSYRRHLQKKIPGAQGLICAHARGLERSSELPISTASLEAKTAAFALLLFRWTMEGWDNQPWFLCIAASKSPVRWPAYIHAGRIRFGAQGVNISGCWIIFLLRQSAVFLRRLYPGPGKWFAPGLTTWRV
jgi:hypothetical protein